MMRLSSAVDMRCVLFDREFTLNQVCSTQSKPHAIFNIHIIVFLYRFRICFELHLFRLVGALKKHSKQTSKPDLIHCMCLKINDYMHK